MAAAGGDWGIIAVSLRSPTARAQLLPQDGVYTTVTASETAPDSAIIGSIVDVMAAQTDTDRTAIIDAMADPAIKIISLTITEKGYGHDPATGGIDRQHPDIAADLENPNRPASAVGLIVAALQVRQKTGAGPVTLLSCDNLPANGAVLRSVVLDYARAVNSPDLADWIAAHVTFPATMVDRITPATTAADIAQLAETAGYYDPGCVMHEAFRQWVIEDDFACGRPAWDQVGAQLVASVEPFEMMKLRCLNGTHSTLAYLGYLAGFETIADCVADADFAALCERLWADEITPVVPQPDGEDLNSYCAALMNRYRDPAIRHRTWQIAMDGSQKLPQRILGTIADNLAAGRVPAGLCMAVAGWMKYVGGVDENGAAIDVRDPMAGVLKQTSDAASDKVAALLGIEEVFGKALPKHVGFCAAVAQAYDKLDSLGAHGAVRDYLRS